ncbi:hypothetical protein [Rubripirellula reticaptiva]|nr:hypothetical protein [Rubripirellula reticaptiva]
MTMLIILIGAGIYGRSHVGLLNENVHRTAGYSMRLMIEGQVHRAFTSLFFTAGGWRFYSSIVMFAVAVGYVEGCFGPLRAIATFFAVHLATLAVMTIGVMVASVISETHRGNLLWCVQDVGPSAGYYGCVGLAFATMASQMRWPLVVAIIVVLCLRATWSFIHLPEDGRMLSADLAHLIAFPLGIASAYAPS